MPCQDTGTTRNTFDEKEYGSTITVTPPQDNQDDNSSGPSSSVKCQNTQNLTTSSNDKNERDIGGLTVEGDPKFDRKCISEEPPSIFLTAALDETVRVWHVDKPKNPLVILTVLKVS